MFCTECGTKLEDNAAFCTNCGHKTEVATAPAVTPAEPAAPVEPVAVAVAPAESTVTAAQPMYSTPATGQSMYAETNSQVTSAQTTPQFGSAATGASYGASQGAYGQSQYGASQNTYGQSGYGTAQNTYGAAPNNAYSAPNASYSYNGPVAQPPKKKGKGCLITFIVVAAIGFLGLLAAIIAVVAGVFVFGGGDDSVEELYGDWYGTSQLVSVSGADEMQEYLEDLIGRPLDEDEIEGLYGIGAEEEWFDMSIFAYDTEGNGSYTDGFWEMWLDMGDYFGVEYWDTYDAVTYDQFAKGDFSTAVITLDENDSFYIEVKEMDGIGEYGCQFFDSWDYDVQEYEVAEDGAYGIVLSGQVVEGSDGKEIVGNILIMFQYGDMSEPYSMTYEYTLDGMY